MCDGCSLVIDFVFLGGVFPYPPAVAQLCSSLCPPECFHGPFVGVDALMEQLLRVDMQCKILFVSSKAHVLKIVILCNISCF